MTEAANTLDSSVVATEEKTVAGGSGATSEKIASGGSGKEKKTPLGIPPTKTTHPKEYLRHNISDDELTMFVEYSRDGLTNAMWGLAGIAAGYLSYVIEKIHGAFFMNPRETLSLFDILEIGLFCAAASAAISIRCIDRKKATSAAALAVKIRARKRI